MRVEIIDITDKSGSMSDIRSDVIGGFNTLLEDQKAVPGEAKFTHVQFDSNYKLVYAGKPIRDVPDLTIDTYVPAGGTALLDAIGRTMNEQGARIKSENWAEKVIVCIRTDGEENSSREFSLAQIKAMITHAQAHGWVFIFSGADIDAFGEASKLGISAAYTTRYDKSDPYGTTQSYYATGQTLRSLREDPNGPKSQVLVAVETQVKI